MKSVRKTKMLTHLHSVADVNYSTRLQICLIMLKAPIPFLCVLQQLPFIIIIIIITSIF